ncbi:MAG: transporter, partial [Gemmatimonadales bacterium]
PPTMRLSIVALLFAAPLLAQDSTAADPRAVQPERPTVATHAHTVAPGYVEIETGVEGDNAGAGRRAYFAPTTTKIGLATHVQLNLVTPVVFAGPGQSSGLGDAGLGVKWRLLDHHAVLGDFALLPAIKFPTGSVKHGTGTGTTDVGVTAIASYDVRGVSMDLNVGYTRVGAHDGHGASNAALWTASFGVPVVGSFSWNIELFGYPTVDGSGNPSTVALLTGPGYLVSRIFNLDMGFISPLQGRQPNAIYAGAVWNVGSLVRRSP